jgi:hypothetical protein
MLCQIKALGVVQGLTLTLVLAVVVLAQSVKTQMVTKVVLAVTEYQVQ